MAIIPFLTTLNLAARTAYPIIRRAVNEGLSGRAIQRTLRSQNLGIKNQTLFDTIRHIKGVTEQSTHLQFLPFNRRPNPARLPQALTPIRNNYGFEVRVSGVQSATDLPMEQFITVGTDEILTRSEIEQIAMDVILGTPANYPMIIESVQLQGGYRSGELGLIPRG